VPALPLLLAAALALAALSTCSDLKPLLKQVTGRVERLPE
jgi:hypothetical protein